MTDDLAGARWFKSSHSGPDRECVEVAHFTGGVVGVRDSKRRTGPALIFCATAWDEFLASVRIDRP
ncbi:DUF397 domain-containing protein [Nocardia jinanensis]|uniref:DUF397 domain-containing protein n=1 Tax=Nocardia jinanensis TaxID=382504 RepID=A0A917RYQ4_9NOCA|nr:DUF397 domain-containing protein [Nocardia jinanensis]GGL45117.1 DUF397 domain-containing protein [Nocardia jinanensis]